MWIVIAALAVFVILFLVVIALREKSKPAQGEKIEPRPCPADCRPCPFCGEPVKRKSTKCLYCGADLEPDLSRDFGGVALAPDVFEQVTGFVKDSNEYEARKYLEKNLGLKEGEARSAIDLYKNQYPDLTERPNWRLWIILACVVLVIIVILL